MSFPGTAGFNEFKGTSSSTQWLIAFVDVALTAHPVTESKLALLTTRQASKSGDEVWRQGVRLSESQQTQKMAD